MMFISCTLRSLLNTQRRSRKADKVLGTDGSLQGVLEAAGQRQEDRYEGCIAMLSLKGPSAVRVPQGFVVGTAIKEGNELLDGPPYSGFMLSKRSSMSFT